jgi:tetratricopeptide (TPR) repeat protein
MQRQRATLVLISILLLLPTRASVPAKRNREAYVEAPELLQLRKQGNDAYRAGSFETAAGIYERGVEAARRRGDARSEVRFLNNLGSANYRLRRYRDAVKCYLQARSLAEAQSNPEIATASSFNLSSLYLQLGEVDSAREAAERGLAIPWAATTQFRSNLLIQLAAIELRKPDCDGAARQLREAIEVSRDRASLAGEAQAWNELGNALLDCRRPDEAEQALLEAYRIRKLTRDPDLHFTYESLAHLRLAQKDPTSALRFLDLAREGGISESWRALHARGMANEALGRAEEAYTNLREAVEQVKNWRSETLPADAFRIRSEVETRSVYSDFIEAAGERCRKTRSEKPAEEAFEAAEDGRAASLRALWAGSDRPRQLPAEYWRTLAELQHAEADQIRGQSDDNRARRSRARLAEMEAAAGLDLPAAEETGGAALLRAAQQALGADEVYLGFHSEPDATWTWAVTRREFQMAEAAPGSDLTPRIGRFVEALRAGRPESVELGRGLYADLFGSLPSHLLAMRRWTIAPDGPLFDLPFCALPAGGKYLIESHELRIATGIHALLRQAPSVWNDRFVGVGDAIYNRADARAVPSGGASRGPANLELPRLPGSGREVESCARVWTAAGRKAQLLEGPEANKRKLMEAAADRPAVLHVAAHMLFPAQESGSGMLALSIVGGGEVELLSETEVAGMPAKVALVVLDGCSSGRGVVLPGAGLMGMTRAWLAAGARAVIATRWPVPDQDSGAIFASLYRLYLERGAAASPVSFGELLRDAQLAELRAGGKRAAPANWASYFSVERN